MRVPMYPERRRCRQGTFSLSAPIRAAPYPTSPHPRSTLPDDLHEGHGPAPAAQLVERTVRIIRELGHEPATPSEAREMLGLSPVEASVVPR